MSRTSIFIASLASSVVALALVSQATGFGDAFIAFALVLLSVVYFLGVVTVTRLGQINWEDARWTQGMNRIRHAYLDLAPELEPYFVTSRYDDDLGILQSSVAMRDWPPRTQAVVAAPGMVAVMDSVVAGGFAGIAAVGLGLGTAGALVLGSALLRGLVRRVRDLGAAIDRALSETSSTCSSPRRRARTPEFYRVALNPKARAGSGAEISSSRTAPIGTTRRRGSSPVSRCGTNERNPNPGSGSTRLQHMPGAVGQLDADLDLLELVLLRERLDHPPHAARRTRRAGRPRPASRSPSTRARRDLRPPGPARGRRRAPARAR